MTAAITESARGSFSGDIIASIRANGIVAIPPGQLWERVAETTPDLLLLSFATAAAIWEVGCRPKWRDERGPIARDIHRSGIIRARERIK